jgi:hypothetical protein
MIGRRDIRVVFEGASADDAIKRAIVEREISDPLTQSRLAAQKVREITTYVAHGATLEETSEFLCRGDTFEVARKAKELGLTWQRGG